MNTMPLSPRCSERPYLSYCSAMARHPIVISLNHDHELHVPVTETAVVIANRLERARRLRRDLDSRHLAGLDIGIDLQRPHHEAMRGVLAGQFDNNRLALVEIDLIGTELEFLRGDFHDAGLRTRNRVTPSYGRTTQSGNQCNTCQPFALTHCLPMILP